MLKKLENLVKELKDKKYFIVAKDVHPSSKLPQPSLTYKTQEALSELYDYFDFITLSDSMQQAKDRLLRIIWAAKDKTQKLTEEKQKDLSEYAGKKLYQSQEKGFVFSENFLTGIADEMKEKAGITEITQSEIDSELESVESSTEIGLIDRKLQEMESIIDPMIHARALLEKMRGMNDEEAKKTPQWKLVNELMRIAEEIRSLNAQGESQYGSSTTASPSAGRPSSGATSSTDPAAVYLRPVVLPPKQSWTSSSQYAEIAPGKWAKVGDLPSENRQNASPEPIRTDFDGQQSHDEPKSHENLLFIEKQEDEDDTMSILDTIDTLRSFGSGGG